MITIWGRNNSINVQKPLWAAAACGVEIDRKDVGGPFGGLDTPEFGGLNPNRLIPVMQDGDFVLWESNAIVRYLAEKHGQSSGFYPKDIESRARANQWLEYVNSKFYFDLVPVFLQLYRVAEADRNQAMIKEKLGNLANSIPVANEFLGTLGTDYVAGNNITFGDVGLGTLLYRYFNMPIERAACPHLEAYYERLSQDQHFKSFCMLPLK